MPLGWIDYSKSERSKVISVLDLLSEPGALDELGIAPIRDGFANLFFPGTTTIQTRAKYFLIVPYALKDLELSDEVYPGKAIRTLDDVERECCKVFMEDNPGDEGIIGSRSLAQGSWVKRPPSEIYWAGIRRYGIFKSSNMSISEYVNAMCALKRRKESALKLGNRRDNAEEVDSDDKNAVNVFSWKFWNLPTYSKKWREELSLNLNKDEAIFLKGQIEKSCPDTLMSFILENEAADLLRLDSFQDMKRVTSMLPEDIQRDYKLAYDFSRFNYILQAVFNMVASGNENELANQIWQEENNNLTELASVDLDAIFKRLGLVANPQLRSFLKQSQTYMKDGDLDSLKKVVTSREDAIKGVNRAKTMHPGEYETAAWFGGGRLGYRYVNAKIIIGDIFEGIGIC